MQYIYNIRTCFNSSSTQAALEEEEEAGAVAAKKKKTDLNDNRIEKGVVRVYDLPKYGCEEPQLRKFFYQFGRIESIFMPRTLMTAHTKGKAHILFSDYRTAKCSVQRKYIYIYICIHTCIPLAKRRCGSSRKSHFSAASDVTQIVLLNSDMSYLIPVFKTGFVFNVGLRIYIYIYH